MFKAKVKNKKGDSLALYPSNDYVVSITGLTPGVASLNYSVVGTKDGSIYDSGRKENRNIVLQIRLLRDVECNRIALYKLFKLKELCEFHFKNGIRDVFIEGRVESVEGDLFEQNQNIQVSVVCNSPNFKAETESVTDISSVVPLFAFPFSIDSEGVEFSKLEKSVEKNVYNHGDAECGLIIEMRAIGETSNPIIYNASGNSFGVKIDMSEGDRIIINTNKGEKSVTLFRSGAETNIINKVYPNPTWFNLEPGDNIFSHTADNPDQLQIVFKHYAQFEGV